MDKRSGTGFSLWIVSFYALVLFSCLGVTPLWLDEIQQFANSRHTTLGELIRWVQLNAGASPLPYLAQHIFTGWFEYSSWIVRFPAALCSVLSGVVFAAICPQFLKGARWIALLLFLSLPIQFRYGVEARVYSQGLLFSLLALWVFLRIEERYSVGLVVLYGLAVAAGLYSQPLTIFPVLAQMPRARRPLWVAAGGGILSYLPWYFAQRRAQKEYALIAPPTAFFSFHQINPLILLHDITGGGYACAIALLLLAGWGIAHEPKQRLLWSTAAFALAGPILMDVVFNYFFAERQLLFAMPALVLLAAEGVERFQAQGRGLIAWAAIAVFLAAAIAKNYRQVITPRDDLAATADAIVNHLRPGACVLAAPPEQIAFYSFFHPELEQRACSRDLSTGEVVAVVSGYTSAAERRNLLYSVAHRVDQRETFRVGGSELFVYGR